MTESTILAVEAAGPFAGLGVPALAALLRAVKDALARTPGVVAVSYAGDLPLTAEARSNRGPRHEPPQPGLQPERHRRLLEVLPNAGP